MHWPRLLHILPNQILTINTEVGTKISDILTWKELGHSGLR